MRSFSNFAGGSTRLLFLRSVSNFAGGFTRLLSFLRAFSNFAGGSTCLLFLQSYSNFAGESTRLLFLRSFSNFAGRSSRLLFLRSFSNFAGGSTRLCLYVCCVPHCLATSGGTRHLFLSHGQSCVVFLWLSTCVYLPRVAGAPVIACHLLSVPSHCGVRQCQFIDGPPAFKHPESVGVVA